MAYKHRSYIHRGLRKMNLILTKFHASNETKFCYTVGCNQQAH